MATLEPTVPFGNLKLDYVRQRNGIDAAVQRVLDSGWFVLGSAGEAFEQAFAAYCGAPQAVGVGSGTEAIHLALLACGLAPGDEVVTAANTCVPTLAAISFAGGVPVLVDVDPSTGTLDPGRIVERLTSRTRFIVPVHLYGQCADMDPILALAEQHGLQVIEDCAQAHGSRYKGRHAGTLGAAGAFSFYPSKNLGGYGDGGAVICADAAVAERLRMLRNYGQRQRYFHHIKGFNSRLDEIQAAILLAKLPGLDASNLRRQQIAAAYAAGLAGLSWIVLPTEAHGRQHAWHLYVVRVPDRERFQRHLASHGVGTMVHYPVPIHRQEAYAECLPQAPFLPVTEALAPHIVSLPIYPELTDAQVGHVIAAVRSFSPDA